MQEQRKSMEEMTGRIISLEDKIDKLITENIMLREKLARMEERLLINAKLKVNRKRSVGE
jgi:hypothetical protein